MALETAKAGREYVTQEKLLYDTVERLGKDPSDWLVSQVYLSRLLPANKTEAKLRIALRMFDQLVSSFRSQVFILSNHDIVVMGKEMRQVDVEEVIDKLKGLFHLDPLTFYDYGSESQFFQCYDLNYSYNDFFDICRKLVGQADTRRGPAPPPGSDQLTPRGLSNALKAIAATDISPFVRRQSIIGFTEKGRGTLAFQEFFVSMSDLERAVSNDVRFTGSRWLFDHLCMTLDLRVVDAVKRLPQACLPKAMSLNLNLTTLTQPGFSAFLDWCQGRMKLVVEVQTMDIFNDFTAYFQARDMLHGRGHRILIDSLSHMSMRMIDPSQFGADMVKLIWAGELPALVEDSSGLAVRSGLHAIGMDRIVLARCDNEKAIMWGIEQGITMFQGRFLDSMLAAVTMAKCEKSGGCTLAQCSQRRGVVSGRARAECPNPAMVDHQPDIRSVKR
ncbi:MAG: hypothetical protein EPN26_03395 [Rhodospirillales bacterium]|nr:MAG: hypothetical protein EPN26_03395 [Rhodospirillales bacterium]